jgi:hypothetical protein
MICTVSESDGKTDKQQLKELTALARKTGMPIKVLIGETITMIIDPAASDDEINKVYEARRLVFIERAKDWFSHRYVMIPRE